MKRAAVVVLGDIGRSPRMQYHALSLAEQAHFEVDLIGFLESEPLLELRSNPHIKIHPLFVPKWEILAKNFLLRAFVKVFVQLLSLFYILLLKISRPDYILVQNPPAIPVLAIGHIVCFLRRSKLVIDWHNFGWTILSLTKPKNHWTVKIYRWYEKFFGKGAFANLCVTREMQKFLKSQWNIEAKVLYDKPAKRFHRLNLDDMHDFFMDIEEDLPTSDQMFRGRSRTNAKFIVESSLFTTKDRNDVVSMKQRRPILLVSSTSWTEDEKFSVLLDSMKLLDDMIEKGNDLSQTQAQAKNLRTKQLQQQSTKQEKKTNNNNNTENNSESAIEAMERLEHQIGDLQFLLVITGKGDLREFYEKKIEEMDLIHVTIKTMWLASEDYPRMLGSADLGISLHASSSGLDLPMKVVDMFGSRLPVCAIDFDCISELVKHGENGMIFKTPNELASQIFNLFREFPRKTEELDKFRNNIDKSFQTEGWNLNWQEIALPIFGGKATNTSNSSKSTTTAINQSENGTKKANKKNK